MGVAVVRLDRLASTQTAHIDDNGGQKINRGGGVLRKRKNGEAEHIRANCRLFCGCKAESVQILGSHTQLEARTRRRHRQGREAHVRIAYALQENERLADWLMQGQKARLLLEGRNTMGEYHYGFLIILDRSEIPCLAAL